MEQLSAPLVSSNEVDGGGGGGGGGMRNHAVKPVIPPKPEGYGTLGRASSRDHHKSENGSATVEQNRLSYSSQRPKSTEMLTEFQISGAGAAAATTATANPPSSSSTATNSNPATRQSPRSPRSKPPAPPVPNSPRPLPHQFSLADSQGSVLADLSLDCPCPLLTQQTGGGGGGGGGNSSSSSGSTIHTGGSKHQSAYEPQLSVWNPLIEPPQLFQSAMDLDLSFDSGNIDPDPSQDQLNLHHHHHQQQQPVIIKPAPPPPLSSMSFQSVQQFYPEPMKPTKVEPPRLPSVPPVSSSLTLNLSMDPLSSSSSRSISKTDPVKPPPNDLNKMMMSKLDHQSVGSHHSSSSTSSSSSGGISAPPSVHSAMQRVEPRVTSDLVKLESNNSMTMTTASRLMSDPLAQSSTSSSVDSSGGAASSSKPSRVLPLKPFPESTTTLSHNKNSSVGCQSLESIQSNPSTIDTTDSPHSLLAPNESISARNALNSELHNSRTTTTTSSQQQQQQLNGLGRATDSSSTDQTTSVTSKHNTTSSSSTLAATAAASAPLSTPLLLPAPHPPPPPPPSSYMTIDIDPSTAAAAAATGSSSTGSGGGDSSGEKIVDFYPPNSFRPYSFHSECWRKEIPEDETKWQMYKRRFSEFVFNFVACCIRCIGPV